MGYRIGVDVGGTFTDFSIFNTESGNLFHFKHGSTPADPSQAIVSGIKNILEVNNIKAEDVAYLAHGTTVATNALIEKKGARIGLITTKGFKDLIEIGWQKRPSLYDLLKPKPQSLVPPGLKCEVTERITYDGGIKIPLDEDETRKVVRFLKEAKAEAIAVCTLFSFINPVHEKRIKEIIEETFPETYVSISSELVPEFREYSRMSTTVLNAYLGPIMRKYVRNFEKSITEVGVKTAPYVTQSNGSIISIGETIDCPIKTAVSGPSAGVIGAARIGNLCGVEKIITFDMGGTSADISLIENGRPQLSSERLVEGYPARIPMIDIVTIGAGGGSIAHIDDGGALKVGPESAGANPGPACYGIGGENPTVTDANIILGKLNRKKLLGGKMDVYAELAQKALEDKVCKKSSLTLREAAAGIISVVNSNMMRAVRVVSVERGYDVRDFSLMAFGGAGPLHACEVAKDLGITSIIIPPSPGTLCSLGLLMADTKFDLSRSNIMIAEAGNLPKINEIFDSMVEEGREMLRREGIAEGARSYQRSVDARYERQNYEISISLPDCTVTEEMLRNVIADFHYEHDKNYGYFNSKMRIQIVNYRVSAIGNIDKPKMKEVPVNTKAAGPVPIETREVLFEGEKEYIPCKVYLKDDITPGCTIKGPLIVEQMDTTTVVPPGWTAYADGLSNLRLSYVGGEKVSQNIRNKVDAVTVEIVGNLLLSIAEETTVAIIKSAYSTNIKERRDVSTALTDPEGNMVAQAENLAIHLGSLLTFVKEVLKKFTAEGVNPGDMFIGNDPYNGGGNHLPDIVVAAPAFAGKKLVGWVVNMAHHSDIGGKVPGSTSVDAVSIFQEGIKIPIIKICESDNVLDNVLDLILANTRVPKERYGDLIAQISANRIGIRRMIEAYEKYGDRLTDCMGELQNYAERRLRSAVTRLPEGEYSFTDYMDDGGPAYPDPLPITVKVKVKADFMEFDFTNTCKQVEAPINVPFNSLLATVFYSLKALIGPDIPSNAGIYRAFKVISTPGSLVSAVHPAPVGIMIDTCQRLPDVIFGALAPVVPERIIAGCNSACTTVVFTGNDPTNKDNFFIYHEAIAGGSGASRHADGLSGVQVHMTNTSNMPIEALEMEFPIITIRKYALRQDSGGAGEFRGGLGIHREFEIMRDGVTYKVQGDRQKFLPWGLEGGADGAGGEFYRCTEGSVVRLPSKCLGPNLKKGEVIKVLTPGSGGYGNAVKRPVEKVLADVIEGHVSIAQAREFYKVCIICDDKGVYSVDDKMTSKLRKQIA